MAHEWRVTLLTRTLALALVIGLSPRVVAQNPPPANIDWKSVDLAMGREGKPQPGGIYKYTFPRGDLRVKVGGTTIDPSLALTGWVAFQGNQFEALAMGDLVLQEQEVTPVLTKLKEMGINPTALHNHLLRESPKIMYLHIEAKGDPTKIAQGVRAALALSGTPPVRPDEPASKKPFPLDTAQIAAALGRSGKINGKVYQVGVPRAEVISLEGMDVSPAMGIATAINFQPTGSGKAVIAGDMVLIPSEVNPVIEALRSAGIEVTALHSHMLSEEPRLLFMHFWGSGEAVDLAKGLGGALQRMNIKRPGS
jgi:hypothetical protein